MAVLYAFFSYSHLDGEVDPGAFLAFSKELESRISAQFVNDRLNIWRDKDGLLTGVNWDATIEASLRESKLLIVMLSPKWLGSDYCRKEFTVFREVERGLGMETLVVPLLWREVANKKRQFTKEQLEIFELLSARQYKSVLVKEFLKLDEDERDVLVEGLAEEIAKTLEPLFEAANVSVVSAPAPAPEAVEAVIRVDATAKRFDEFPDMLEGILASTRSAPESIDGPVDIGLDFSPSTSAVLPPHNLPLATIGDLFMGRDDMLGKLAKQLRGARAVLALHGMGGIGKTRLAIEYAWRHALDYSALLFVSAETPEILNTSLASLAATLNLQQQNEPQDPVKIAAVLAWLAANSNWLLILDNVDDAKAAGAVVDLLPKLASGNTLITARYERFPPAVTLLRVDVLAPEPAHDFLLARTQAGRRANEDDSALAAELAEELGYLALALEQAGAFIAAQRISFERYLAYWRDERARVVDWFDKTAMGSNHDRGLAAVWTTSVARLSPQARRLFDRIAFLAPEPIPEFLLDVVVPKSGPDANEHPQNTSPHPEEPQSGVSKDATDAGVAGFGPFETRPSGAPQGEAGDNRSDARAEDKFDARAALGELYAYSLAAPTEIEGRYRQPAFSVHRLVQDFARDIMDETRKKELLRETLSWVNGAFDGDPGDVRNWPRLDPLAVHAQIVAETADEAGIAEPTARLVNDIAQLFHDQARTREAEPLMRRALDIDERSFGIDHPDVAIRLNNLAQLLHATNRLAEAEPLMRRALDISEKSFGPDHPQAATELNNLARLLHDANRLAEAEPLMRRALDIGEQSLGTDHPKVAIRLNNLATLLKDAKRLAEAVPLLRRALDINEKNFGPDHPKVAKCLNDLAQLLLAANRFAEAEPLMRRALDINEKSFGPDHSKMAIPLNNLGGLLQLTNRIAEAEPLFHRAVRIFATSLGPDHPNAKGVANNYLLLLRERGASEEEAETKVAAAMRGE